MSSLSLIEKQKLERELRMSGGYLLDFSNRRFEEFYGEVVGISIYDDLYLNDSTSGSKAKRTRVFWKIGSDKQVLLFLNGILDGWEFYSKTPITEPSEKIIKQIIQRLKGSSNTKEKSTTKQPNAKIDTNLSQIIHSQLIELTSMEPRPRGIAFEKFLKDLFNAYELSANSSFRLAGEEIDGSFVLNNETYLLEAKWKGKRTGAADLHIFEGKLSQKAAWSRGLFISNSGFTPNGLQAFGKGKRIICMDGFDLSEMLRLRLSIAEVLEAKTRRAAETGNPFTPVRELFM